jgi:apoptosis-inducing factor 2
MKRVVIVGGGYAGTLIAKELDAEADVVLVDPRDAFVNASSSMRAMVRAEWSAAPFFRYDTLLRRGRVVRDLAVSADPHGIMTARQGRLDADYLVLATGASHAYPARPRSIQTSVDDAIADLRDTGAELARSPRVLILGAGPVGLELAGEIRDAWPDKQITVVAPSTALLPGFLPEVRDELRRQLDALSIDLRLGATLVTDPPTDPGTAGVFTATTTNGDAITADIWFRSYGSNLQTGYLADGKLVTLTAGGAVPVDAHLSVPGHSHVFAVGDIADLPDAKMATHAQTQAATVVENIRAGLRGRPSHASYEPASAERIFLTLGPHHGVGQLPTPDGGATPAPLQTVIDRKGADLFTHRFGQRFDVRTR